MQSFGPFGATWKGCSGGGEDYTKVVLPMSNGMVSVMEYLRLGISGVTCGYWGQDEESLWGCGGRQTTAKTRAKARYGLGGGMGREAGFSAPLLTMRP